MSDHNNWSHPDNYSWPKNDSDPAPPEPREPAARELNLEDYLNALNRIGPLAAEWRDKPHRLVYDLAAYSAELRAEWDAAKNNIALINAPSFACGLIYGNNGPFVGGCGKPVLQHESYRCADCTASFHRDCINKHFELDAYVKALREEHIQQPIKDWKEAVARAERRAEAAEASLLQAREALEKIQTVAVDYQIGPSGRIDKIRTIAYWAALASTSAPEGTV